MTDKANQSYWKLFQRTTTELGLVNALWYAAFKALSRLSNSRIAIHRYYLVAQPIDAPADQAERSGGALTIRQIFPGDAVVEIFPRPPKVIAGRFASGAICFGAFMRGEFAGFLWLAENAYEEDEVRCCYQLTSPSSCVWDFDVYVEPRYRIGRTFSRLWETASRHITRSGRSWSISRISAFNPGSLASHRRLGLQNIATATFISIGGLQISLTGLRPFVHISTRPQSRPTLKLSPPPQAPDA